MNTFVPIQQHPAHRAPDLLVIIGSKHLSATLATAKNPLLRRRTFQQVIEEVSRRELLAPVPYPELQRFVGATRIIVFEEPWCEEKRLLGNATNLVSEENEFLNGFAVFRFAFTQQMAALFWDSLGYEAARLREMLERLVSLGYLRYSIDGNITSLGK